MAGWPPQRRRPTSEKKKKNVDRCAKCGKTLIAEELAGHVCTFLVNGQIKVIIAADFFQNGRDWWALSTDGTLYKIRPTS